MRELECNRALLTMALINGADVSMPAFELQDDSFNIHRGMSVFYFFTFYFTFLFYLGLLY